MQYLKEVEASYAVPLDLESNNEPHTRILWLFHFIIARVHISRVLSRGWGTKYNRGTSVWVLINHKLTSLLLAFLAQDTMPDQAAHGSVLLYRWTTLLPYYNLPWEQQLHNRNKILRWVAWPGHHYSAFLKQILLLVFWLRILRKLPEFTHYWLVALLLIFSH